MEKIDILGKIGLDDHESTIYLALLEHGPSYISDIAKTTGIHRPTIYKIIPLLQKRGLVSQSPKGKRVRYVAESPEKLKDIVNQLVSNVDAMLPELEKTYESQGKRPIVKYVEGKEGIRSIFEDIVASLPKGGVFYRYSSTRGPHEEYLSPRYKELRDQKQIERFVITSQERIQQKSKRLDRAEKAVPPQSGLFDYDIVQLIYGSKVAFVDYNT